MIAVPFGLAAVWTLWRQRRLDLWTVCGCICAVLPNFWNLSLIREGIALYKNGAWNRPGWRALADVFYVWPLAVLAAMFLVSMVSLPIRGKSKVSTQETSPDGESLVCWAGFTVIPMVAILLAKATSGMFTLRYFSMYSLGCSLLLAYLLERSVKGSRWIGYLAGGGALVAFACVATLDASYFNEERYALSTSCNYFSGLLEQQDYRESRVLIGDPHAALQIGLYCDELRNRVAFGTDPALALLYQGNNTDNKGMLYLRQNPPITIEPLSDFVRGQRHKLVVFHSESSILKQYFAHEPEYAGRIHLLTEAPQYSVYRLDPAAAAGDGAGEK